MSTKRKFGTDTIIAIAAVVVAVCSMAVAVYEGSQTRKHNRLSVLPKLTPVVGLNWKKPKDALGFSIENNGTGPAIINSVTVYLDGKPMPQSNSGGWLELFEKLELFGQSNRYYKFDTGDALSVGQSKKLLAYDPDLAKEEGETPVRFYQALERISVKITYASVYGNKQVTCINSTLLELSNISCR